MEATHIQKNHKGKDQEGTVKSLQNIFQKERNQEDKEDEDINNNNDAALYIWMRKHQAFNRSFSKTFKYEIR